VTINPLLFLILSSTPLSAVANSTFQSDNPGISNFLLINVAVFILMLAAGYFYWKRYKQLGSLKNFYAVAIKYHFDKSIKESAGDTEIKRTRLLNKSEEIFDDENRFSIRVPVPPKMLIVYWKDESNTIHSGDAIDISVHGIKFHCATKNIKTIDQIVCPSYKTSFIIKRSFVQTGSDNTAAAIIECFQQDTRDQIRWVELITSIYQP